MAKNAAPTITSPLAAGWKTSEGKLTGLASGLYALGSVAEAVGWIPPGSTDTLMPVLGLVATYMFSRTALKAVQARREATPQAVLSSVAATAAPLAPLAPLDPMAGLARAFQALNQAKAIQSNLEGMARGILGILPGEPASAPTAIEIPPPTAAPAASAPEAPAAPPA